MSDEDVKVAEDYVHAKIVGADKDGGAAFGGSFDKVIFHGKDGTVVPSPLEFRSRGMSLRDYFAAKAMPEAIRTMQSHRRNMIDPPEWDKATEAQIAESCYSLADAMLKARK